MRIIRTALFLLVALHVVFIPMSVRAEDEPDAYEILAEIQKILAEEKYVYLEPIIVNVKDESSSRPSFARLKVVLLPLSGNKKDVENSVPVIVDRFNQYLGGISLKKIQNPDGVKAVKTDMTSIARQVTSSVDEVLIQEILVQ